MNSLWHGNLPSTTQLLANDAPVTGVSGTSAVGDITVVAKATASLGSVSATGYVGSLGSTGALVATLTGIAAQGLVGNLVSGTAAYVTSVSATGSVGDMISSITGSTVLSSVLATGSVGDVSNVVGTANVTLNGVVANISAGGIIVWGDVFNDPGNTWTEIL